MSKRVYISTDCAEDSGDRDVADILNQWGSDNRHKVNFIDMSEVVSDSVSNGPDCRPCDLKREFNQQINASSIVILIVGDKTASRKVGSSCSQVSSEQVNCSCTSYKQSSKGSKTCKMIYISSAKADSDVGNINAFSYLQHESEQVRKRKKPIIIVYNLLRKELNWLPSYMKGYESDARSFWKKNDHGEKVGDYTYIKQVLGYAQVSKEERYLGAEYHYDSPYLCPRVGPWEMEMVTQCL